MIANEGYGYFHSSMITYPTYNVSVFSKILKQNTSKKLQIIKSL